LFRNAKLLDALILLLFAGLCVFLTLNRHSRSGTGNYKSEIFSDKAGYYVYLPATFQFGWDGRQVPDSILARTGKGFFVDDAGRIETKYTYGVALLQLPFYLTGRAVAGSQDAFGLVHHKMVDLTAVAYLVLGMVMLYHFLRRFAKRGEVYATLGLLFLGTGLLHYSIQETGMSHVYSFFAFAGVLLAWVRYLEGRTWRRAMVLGLAAGLVVILRPVNVLFFLSLPLVAGVWADAGPAKGHGLDRRIRGRNVMVHGVMVLGICLLLLLPQMAYWYHLSGNPLHYSYGGEGFSHLLGPPVHKLWFAAQNSLFVWTPVWVLVMVGIFLKGNGGPVLGWKWLGYFLVLSYVFASWHQWYYGCAFGSRPFVEYAVLFTLPLLRVVRFAWERRVFWQGWAVSVFCVIAVGVSLKLFFAFDGCFYSTTWDFGEYFRLLF
jgi:hypothetical protein